MDIKKQDGIHSIVNSYGNFNLKIFEHQQNALNINIHRCQNKTKMPLLQILILLLPSSQPSPSQYRKLKHRILSEDVFVLNLAKS